MREERVKFISMIFFLPPCPSIDISLFTLVQNEAKVSKNKFTKTKSAADNTQSISPWLA